MTTLKKLHAIEKEKIIYDIHYCNAGVGIKFYNPPAGYKRSEDYHNQDWRKYLTVDQYYPTFVQCINAEYKKLIPF